MVGLACWYPGAPSAAALWENVLARRQQFRRVPDVRLPLADYYSADRQARALRRRQRLRAPLPLFPPAGPICVE